MNFGLIGRGVVGNALYESFLKKNINISVYDKFKNIGNIKELLFVNYIFLCLPTLFKDNEYDKSAIYETCEFLSNNKYKGLVIIKSTIEPEISEFLANKYNLNVCHNPEFLSAKTALDDFENQSHIVIGKTKKCDMILYNNLVLFYKQYYPNAKISLCNSNESELMKISINNFYAVKIQFFNELFLISMKLDSTNYNVVKNMMLENNWINPMHTEVPGHDGQLSYGGMCFPKDTNAFLNYLKRKKSYYKLIEATIKERNELRDD